MYICMNYYTVNMPAPYSIIYVFLFKVERLYNDMNVLLLRSQYIRTYVHICNLNKSSVNLTSCHKFKSIFLKTPSAVTDIVALQHALQLVSDSMVVKHCMKLRQHTVLFHIRFTYAFKLHILSMYVGMYVYRLISAYVQIKHTYVCMYVCMNIL